jgi:hypothetical protein
MKNTNKMKWITAVVAILALLLLLNTFRLNKKVGEQETVITQQQLDNQTTKEIVNKQGKTITSQKVIITQSQESINLLTDSIFDLKAKDAKNTNTIAYYKAHIKVRVDTVKVPYTVNPDLADRLELSDSLIQACKDVIEQMDAQSVPTGTVAEIVNDSLSLKATINKNELVINELTIPDTLQLRFVEHKGKLFKRGSVEVQFFHTNPLFKTEKASSAYFQPKKKSFLQRVLLPIGIGIGAGLLIAK